jgi:steroid delta-isomerase-like uncharacterized protein
MTQHTPTDRTLIDIVETGFEGWNQRDFDKIGSRVDDDYVFESDALPHPLRGRAALLQFARTYLDAFPDLEFTLDDAFAAADRVVVSWEATGTHEGTLNGVAPTGRRVHLHGCTISHFRDGRVVRQQAFWDMATLMRQIGDAE